MDKVSDLANSIGPIGVNAISQGVGSLFGIGTSMLQHKYNKELAELNFNQNLEMWRKQNAYNSPIEQRKRLESAGLNPALLYGNGSVSVGNSNSIPQYQQMGVDIGQNMMSALQMAQVVANIKNTEADTQAKKTENKYISPRNEAIIDNYIQDTATKRSTESLNLKNVEFTSQQIVESQHRVDEIIQSIEYKKMLTSHEGEKKKLTQLQQAVEVLNKVFMQESINKTQAETEQTKIMSNRYAQLLPYEIQESMSRTAVNKSQKTRTDEMLPYDKGESQKRINKIHAEWIYQDWYNAYWKETGVRPDAGAAQAIQNILGSMSIQAGKGIDSTNIGEIISHFNPGYTLGLSFGDLFKSK